MIAEIVRRHGIAPRQCLYVGDTFSDIEAARTNGISCIAVTYGMATKSRCSAETPHMWRTTSRNSTTS
ncbi:HAD family hydrolase [Bifidobacterium longum]|uniref:HAD family hydrolase n=1 Tax=Bifidobacterium longum TaxID=216816 RepID=UPI0021F8091D|nr:HAD hydrolase-like protein [Bifidobacterium longum]